MSMMELHFLVLLSFFFQIVLILFGNRSNYVPANNRCLKFLVWFTYISSDSVATISLAILSNDHNFIFMATWSAFLLLHLGGPDTITAYSTEDNERWLRRLLQFLFQLATAVYAVCMSWNATHPNSYVTVMVLVAGIIKCCERIWSLRSASSKKFRESIVLDHPQGSIANDSSIMDASVLHDGSRFFKTFKCLFADLPISFEDRTDSQVFFGNKSWDYAFQVVEVELGLMYDILYTKALLACSRLGIFLKAVSFLCTLSAFLMFCYLIDKPHMNDDHIVTYVLFIGAIFIEIYAVIALLSSSWGMLWLSKCSLYKSISWFKKCVQLSHTKRWSNLMSQLNLMSFALRDEPLKCINILKFLHIYEFFEKSYYQHTRIVPRDLEILIFYQLMVKSHEALDVEACKKLCAHRGDRVLDNLNCHVLDWSVKVEFDQSILLWHIATDLCYHLDTTDNSSWDEPQNCVASKLLSNYMLYLLVKCPFMLPNGIGQIRFADACAELHELLQVGEFMSKRNQACEMILQVNTEIPPSEVKGDESKSILYDACRLAKSLHSLEIEQSWSKERKWEMISHVWVEMLCHASSHCRGVHHAKQLSQGGELLTHVWLLMAHLGISEQFQISRGHEKCQRI